MKGQIVQNQKTVIPSVVKESVDSDYRIVSFKVKRRSGRYLGNIEERNMEFDRACPQTSSLRNIKLRNKSCGLIEKDDGNLHQTSFSLLLF